MKLELQNITHVANAIANSNNTRYEIGYTILEQEEKKTLCRVEAKVFEVNKDGEEFKGTLTFAFDKISTDKFPYSQKFTSYVDAFAGIVNDIQSSLIDADSEQNEESTENVEIEQNNKEVE